MPKELEGKLIWLFLLSPGFISFTIIGMIVDLGQLSEFQITYYSFVLTVVNLAIALGLMWPLSAFRRWRGNQTQTWEASTLLGVSIVVSLVMGLALGYAAERDAFFVALRALPITDSLNKRSSSRPVTFLLSQNTRGKLNTEGDARPTKQTEAWVIVTLKNDKRYEGWPEFYGLGKEKSQVYLSPACEIGKKVTKADIQFPPACGYKKNTTHEAVARIPGPGIILYEDEIRSIALLDRACSACYWSWYPDEAKDKPTPTPAAKAR